jgi:hypothetical protein
MKTPNLITIIAPFMLILIGACDDIPENIESKIPVISLHEQNYIEDPSSLVESGEILLLSSQDEKGLFARIGKLLFAGDTLVIYDNQTHKILLYDNRGNFLHTLESQGKGPGEYVSINDVIYHDFLYILDPSSAKILSYDLSGKWKESIPFNASRTGSSFSKLQNVFLFYRNSIEWMPEGKNHNFASFSADSLQFIDSASNIVKELASRGIYTTNPFVEFEDAVYALPPFEDVIYMMDELGQIDSAFFIDVPKGSKLSEEQEWSKLNLKDMAFVSAQNKFQSIHFFGGLLISDRHILFSFRKNQQWHFCLFDKKTGKSNYFESNRLLNQEGLSLISLGVQGDEFYFGVRSQSRDLLSRFVGKDLDDYVSQVLYKVRFKHSL